jgi:hypothetical protein
MCLLSRKRNASSLQREKNRWLFWGEIEAQLRRRNATLFNVNTCGTHSYQCHSIKSYNIMWLCPIWFETAHFPPKRLARFWCTALKPPLMLLTGVVNVHLVRSAQIIICTKSAKRKFSLYHLYVFIIFVLVVLQCRRAQFPPSNCIDVCTSISLVVFRCELLLYTRRIGEGEDCVILCWVWTKPVYLGDSFEEHNTQISYWVQTDGGGYRINNNLQ